MKNKSYIEAQFLESLGQEVQRTQTIESIPPGYIEVKLSTKGRVGAPAVVHVRNFNVGELLDLSITPEIDFPRRLINILSNTIYEDTDVASWHESEIEELLIYIYSEFYRSTLDSVEFPLTQEDYEAIKLMDDGDQLLEDVKNRKWIPRTSVNLLRDVDAYEIPDDYTPEITITNKKTGFYTTFSYIKYGDRLTVKNWLDSIFAEEDRMFAKIAEDIAYNDKVNDSEKKRHINKEEELKYKDFLAKKVRMLTDASRLISVVNVNGQDVSNLPLNDKFEFLSKEARIDYGMITKLIARQDKQPFGLKPHIHMINPITNQPCTRRFSFRISTILSAMQLSGPDEYDDGFDDEDS